MPRFCRVLATIGFAAVMLSLASADQDVGRTTKDGVYTESQAQRGEVLFNERCAMCHGPAGAGVSAPSDTCGGPAPHCALAGPRFMEEWSAMTLSVLFDRVRSSMPTDNPGSLTRPQTAQVIAYVLKVNGFPSGGSDLPSDATQLRQLRYEW